MVAPPFNGLLCGKFVHANVPSEHFVQPKEVRFGAAVVGIVVGTDAAVVGIVVGTGGVTHPPPWRHQ